MQANILFADTTQKIMTNVKSYEQNNFFLKLVFEDGTEHNIALGFIRELIWTEEEENE